MNNLPAALITALALCTTTGCGRKPTPSASKEAHAPEVVTNSPKVIRKYKEATNPMAIALEASDNEMVLVVTYRISSPTSEGDWYGLKLADVSGHVYESTNVGGNFTAIKEKLSEPYTFTGSVGFEIPSNTDIRTFSIGDTAFDIQEMFSRSASQKN